MYETNEKDEKEKKRHYNERAQIVEHGSFSPLVFSALGGMARECGAVYKRQIELLAEKKNQKIDLVAPWVRRRILFALMKMIVVCIREKRHAWEKDSLSLSLDNDVDVSENDSNINRQ